MLQRRLAKPLVTAHLRRRADLVRSLNQRAGSICLTADGVVSLDLGCSSSREAQLGPADAAYTRSGIVVAKDGSLKKSGAMGAAAVAKDGHMQASSVAFFGQPQSIRPELTGIALALESFPADEVQHPHRQPQLYATAQEHAAKRFAAEPLPSQREAATASRSNTD